MTFTGLIGKIFMFPLRAIIALSIALRIHPNTLTFIGLLINSWAAFKLARGHFISAGFIIVVANIFDFIDGKVAHETGLISKFGGFWDSVIDRISDIVLFIGLIYLYTAVHRADYVMVASFAMMFALMTSYTRARAESLIAKCKVVERVELATSGIGDRGSGIGDQGSGIGGDAEILQAALEQFYTEHPAPPEIHLPIALSAAETEIVEAWLTDRSEHRVRIVVPKRGEKRGLLDLAARNAQVAYQTRFNESVAAHYDALETLRIVLNLPAIPRRIECFDISTIQGSETVASMVVCEDGRMKRSEYRKFKIRGQRSDLYVRRGNDPIVPTPDPPSPIPDRILDDFASMEEVVRRRYRKVLENGGPFPDLILIDGGKGQLSAAYAALESLGLANLIAVGIAKKEELLFTREHVEPMALATNSPALLLIQRIRDEAHRFAITFHRQSRARRDLRSALDDIPGVGPRRRKALLTAFGSLAGVRRATREDLIAVVGAKPADQVLAYFAGQP